MSILSIVIVHCSWMHAFHFVGGVTLISFMFLILLDLGPLPFFSYGVWIKVIKFIYPLSELVFSLIDSLPFFFF